MNRIIFNLAAKTDKAGRPSSPNQDNLWVCPDLAKWQLSADNIIGTDEDVELSNKGALLAVADGMGGMNAGEVASMLVIEGIKRKFSNIPDTILTNDIEIKQFIYDAITESDESIKEYAKEHPEAEGLGSTIVLVWILNGKAYCGWCGDSRIYRFNPNNELVRLSHDHSYVQSLVDEGSIPEEDAFDHPDGNIITKSLGDNGTKAEPELRIYDVYQRDVFLLCSDGLCGLLTDTEINEIIQATCTSSKDSLKALWDKGQEKGWSDNVSIDILCIVDGGKPAKGRPDGYPKIAKKIIEKKKSNKPNTKVKKEKLLTEALKTPYLYIIAFAALCIMSFVLYKMIEPKPATQTANQDFYVETPNKNNEDCHNIETGTQNGQRQNNDTNTRRNSNHSSSSKPANNTSNRPNKLPNTNNGSSHNSNGGIEPGVINQLNNNQQNGNQNSQSGAHYPSPEYLALLNTVQNDYNATKTVWANVKRQKYRTRETDNSIKHYLSHINNNLRSLKGDTNNYNALKDSNKSLISAFENLAKELKVNYWKYSDRRSAPGTSMEESDYNC